ncbi:MAG: sigma-70 family RNA polymerase sigma factor [Microthrixaceae bacterium]|nr:sigma-70 family RNA polymerase sigma factor [Microthrixaceae bacterium]
MLTTLAGRPDTTDHDPSTEHDDLVVKAAAGDHRAFARLHRRYERLVLSVVRAEMRRGSTSAEVDDVAQEVFTLMWQRLGTLRDPARLRPWLMQITRRAVIDHARKASRRPILDSDDEVALELTSDGLPGPDVVTEMGELADQLKGALAGLSRRDATAITLAAQFGFGPAEIGQALGITPNNAKVVLHRARARLRTAVQRPVVAA